VTLSEGESQLLFAVRDNGKGVSDKVMSSAQTA
jgi:hypothetical protein